MTSSMIFDHLVAALAGFAPANVGFKDRCLRLLGDRAILNINELNPISHQPWFTSYIDSPWQEIVASEYKCMILDLVQKKYVMFTRQFRSSS